MRAQRAGTDGETRGGREARRCFLPYFRAPILLIALCLLLASRAGAAVSFSTETRPPVVAHYDRAARDLGLRQWPPYFENRQGLHVFVHLRPDEVNLSLWLPPGSVAASRLQGQAARLAREMGWQEGEVITGSYPWGVSVRAELKDVADPGLGRRRYTVDLDALRRWSRSLGQEPAWTGVRCDRGRILRLQPSPTAQGRVRGQDYAFYTAPSAGALEAQYGLTDRWLTALGSWAALWVLFPTVTLLAARHHVRGLRRPEPVERLKLFRNWQGATVGATVGTALLTTVWLFMPAAGYLFGRFSPILLIVAWFGASALVSLQGRLIGLPLEREAEPEKALGPWYRVALGQVLSSIAGIAALAALLWFFTLGRTTWLWQWAGPIFIGIVVLVVLGVIVGVGINLLLTRRRFLKGLEPAPEELASPTRRLGIRTGAPEVPVFLSKERFIGVSKEMLAIPKDVYEKLRPDQAAALGAAEALFQSRQRSDRLGRMLTGGFVAAIVLLGMQSVVAVLTGGRPWVLLWLVAAFVFPLGIVPVSRRWTRMREEADLEVADTFENPRDFLEALQKMEEIQSQHLDPAVRDSQPTSERRQRLQKRLGLD